MELRGGPDKKVEMPASSLGYNINNNRELSASSSKLSSHHAPAISTVDYERRDGDRDEGQAQDQPHHHHRHPQLNSQQDAETPAARDHLNPDPDPAPSPPIPDAAPGATISQIVGGSRPKTPSPPPTTNGRAAIRYRECLKNHAASMGGHVVDGCGEFMPAGEEGSPEALKCAACNCHRNFHRKEVDGDSQPGAPTCYYSYSPSTNSNRLMRSTMLPPPRHQRLPPPSLPLQPHPRHKYTHGLSHNPPTVPIPPMMVAFGSGGPAESSSEDLNAFHANASPQMAMQPQPQPQFTISSKKRFRTKFTPEQKEKMMEFAEKLEWKIQKQDEEQVQQFCSEVGVKRQVFKVWMHNNKQSMKKKQL
ncbi:zinc-finger homeodomain protein 6 [Malania oleifera]|uniref:zinc-finger homeodomain protein 6 n=1 Tax=Malania oleifera TaxID=397392 RepID=UPI0025AEA090|nr:zinc-finger homeodomain protein 6 [Malania oleifera]